MSAAEADRLEAERLRPVPRPPAFPRPDDPRWSPELHELIRLLAGLLLEDNTR